MHVVHFCLCFLDLLRCLWGCSCSLAHKRKSILEGGSSILRLHYNCGGWHGYRYHTSCEIEEVYCKALHCGVVLWGKGGGGALTHICFQMAVKGNFRSLLMQTRKLRFVWVGMWVLRLVMLCHGRNWGMRDCTLFNAWLSIAWRTTRMSILSLFIKICHWMIGIRVNGVCEVWEGQCQEL